MIYQGLADVVVLLHITFVLFVVLGGLLVLRWRRVAWAHVPAALWGVVIEWTGRECPLTPLENWLRARGGQPGYAGGFVEASRIGFGTPRDYALPADARSSVGGARVSSDHGRDTGSRMAHRQRRKRFTQAQDHSTRDLLHYARDHLASAGVLFQQHPRCYDSAGYLSHLGIELLLKSILLHHTGCFPGEHDLGELLRKVKEAQPGLVLSAREQATLRLSNQFSEARYPTPKRPVEIGSQDWDAIKALYRALRDQLPPALRAELTSQTVAAPPGLKPLRPGGTVVEKAHRILMRKGKEDRGEDTR